MKRLIYLWLSLLVPLLSHAQAPKVPVGEQVLTGNFYVSVDDSAKIFINGKEVYRNSALGRSKSPEITLKVGDRVVVQLRNGGMPRYFVLAFAASDKSQVINFHRQVFKQLPDPDATDFTASEFARVPKFAKSVEMKADPVVPFRTTSDYVWGEFDECAIAAAITPQMLSPYRAL